MNIFVTYMTVKDWLVFTIDPYEKLDKERMKPYLGMMKQVQALNASLSFRWQDLVKAAREANRKNRVYPLEEEETACNNVGLMMKALCRHYIRGPFRKAKNKSSQAPEDTEEEEDLEEGEESEENVGRSFVLRRLELDLGPKMKKNNEYEKI